MIKIKTGGPIGARHTGRGVCSDVACRVAINGTALHSSASTTPDPHLRSADNKGNGVGG